jgi:hypothetical protein
MQDGRSNYANDSMKIMDSQDDLRAGTVAAKSGEGSFCPHQIVPASHREKKKPPALLDRRPLRE